MTVDAPASRPPGPDGPGVPQPPLTWSESPVEDADFGVPQHAPRVSHEQGSCLAALTVQFTGPATWIQWILKASRPCSRASKTAGRSPEEAAARLATLALRGSGLRQGRSPPGAPPRLPRSDLRRGQNARADRGDRRADLQPGPARPRHPHDRRGPPHRRRRRRRDARLARGRPLPDGGARARRVALPGRIAVLAAGTSDLPVAEEAAVVAPIPRRDRRARLRRRSGRACIGCSTGPRRSARPTW